jgi:hypothetical protein
MPSPDDLCRALRRLNRLLKADVERITTTIERKPGEDLFRGLYVERDEALAGWDRAAQGKAPAELGGWVAECRRDPLFAELAREFPRFDPIDYGILLLALAAEFDPGYERVFEFLQDDVTRRRPTVGLAMDLLEGHVGGRGALLRRLSEVAPLRLYGLADLADPADGRTGLLGKVLRPDEQYARRALGVRSLDRRLTGAATLVLPQADLKAIPVTDALRSTLAGLAAKGGGQPVRLYLYGPDERAKEAIAEALARGLSLRLLTVDLPRLLAAERSFAETARVLAREGQWFGNLLYLEGVEAFHPAERHREWVQLTAALVRRPCPVVLSGTRPGLPPTPHPVGLLPVEVAPPSTDARVKYWQEALARHGESPPARELGVLAERYPLTRTQIDHAAAVAAARAQWRLAAGAGGPAGPTFDELTAAARAQGSYELESLTHKVSPRVRLKHLVVGNDVREQLGEIVARVRRRDWVLEDWGFGSRQSYGNGVNALFAGPSGTGKTMAAEAIAAELGRDLHKIDLTAVVSKYIGETEQRLERVFQAATQTQAVLFFDEADSLLGKRSEVRDAHDRYANIEVSYLLQRMESYDGLIVLATNLPGNLDDAFLRRMALIVRFRQPGPAERRQLWERVWPKQVPFAREPGYALDPDFLAEHFELTGGGIRNSALAAAFAAADRDWFRKVTMWDVLQAVRREYQKLGRAIADADLGLLRFRPPPAAPPAAGKRPTPAEAYEEAGR